MPDTIETLDQLYDGHTCSNCLHCITCKKQGPCNGWQEDIVDFNLKTYPIKAKPRALNVKWSLESEECLKVFNTNIEDELLKYTGELNGPDDKTDNT